MGACSEAKSAQGSAESAIAAVRAGEDLSPGRTFGRLWQKLREIHRARRRMRADRVTAFARIAQAARHGHERSQAWRPAHRRAAGAPAGTPRARDRWLLTAYRRWSEQCQPRRVRSTSQDTRMVEGTQIGSYRIVKPLGAGGMSEVFVAEHALLGRRAAIKVLRSRLSRQLDIVQRMFNEARIMRSEEHTS